jgi:DtxR family Mn-dependent transcriptional regulator
MEQTRPSQTIEDYLSFIYILERDGEPIVGARLAELIGVTPPTVTNTLKRMERDGLISTHEHSPRLTPQGLDSARTVLRRHMLTEWMMLRMLPWSRLHGEAHNLEHAISGEAESALYEDLGRPQTCPHGNPLPGNEAFTDRWQPLSGIPAGTTVTVRRVHELAEADRELMVFLEEHKIMPGQQVAVSEVLPFNQTLTVQAQGKPVTLGLAVAGRIFVEEAA